MGTLYAKGFLSLEMRAVAREEMLLQAAGKTSSRSQAPPRGVSQAKAGHCPARRGKGGVEAPRARYWGVVRRAGA